MVTSVMSHRASTVKQSPYGMSGITCGRDACGQVTVPHICGAHHKLHDEEYVCMEQGLPYRAGASQAAWCTWEVSKTSWLDSYMAYRCV